MIEKAYKLTFETNQKQHLEKRLEILEHSFNEMRYLFSDRKYKDISVYHQNVDKNWDKVKDAYLKKENSK